MAAPKQIDFTNIEFCKVWQVPLSRMLSKERSFIRKGRQEFIDEYYPSGHKIYDTNIYPDLYYKISQNSKLGQAVANQYGKSAYKIVPRKRISLPIQKDATRVILAHIFGNPIVHTDISPNKSEDSNKRLSVFKNLWTYYNMDYAIRDFFGRSLICGDAAFFLTINKRKEIVAKTLSFLDGDVLAVRQDTKGEVLEIYRRYTVTDEKNEHNIYTDVITSEFIATYDNRGELLEEQPLVYSFIPAVYHCRREGAWWWSVQPNIEELEIEFSDLAQDNKAKAKGKYFMSTTNPQKVRLENFAESDVFVADRYSDMKYIEPTTLSEAFKFTMDENKEIISRSLGYIFPKVQNSGDMPTGSMKAQFFPTERICMDFINEFSPILDEISWIFQQLADNLYPELKISELHISSKIKLFSPIDNLSALSTFADALSKGGATPRSIVDAMPQYFNNDDLEQMEQIFETIEVSTETTEDNNTEEGKTTNKQIGFQQT